MNEESADMVIQEDIFSIQLIHENSRLFEFTKISVQ